MKAILWLLTLTSLVFATDQLELIQELDDYQAQLLNLEEANQTSETIVNIEEIKNQIYILKNELRHNHQPNPPKKTFNVITTSDDFESFRVTVYDWTETSYRIIAKIQNRSFIYAEWVKVHFKFYQNNIMVGDELTYIDYETYQNSGVLPFHDSFVETFVEKMTYDEIRVEFEYDEDELGHGTALCEELLQLLQVHVGTGSLAQWTGSVNNSAGYSVEYPKIFANIFDEDNILIDLDNTYLDTESQGNCSIIIDYVIDSPLEAQEISLYNCTKNSVDISDWILGNSITNYSYKISSNTIIEAGGSYSFNNDDLNFTIGTDDETIYLFDSDRTLIDTWTKDESDYWLDPFTTCGFDSYLSLPDPYEKIKYRLNYSINSLSGSGTIAPNRPRFTLNDYEIAPQTPFTFQLYLLDPNDDAVEFQVDWGDGERTGWLGPYESRTLGSIEHAYEWFGDYWITARSRDVHGAISAWCDSISVFVDWVVPVELSSFTARAFNNAVQLLWQTESESNNLGFKVERSTNKINWQDLGFVQGQGTTTASNSYIFEDTNPPSGQLYYRVKQVDTDGSANYSDIVSITANMPHSFEITSIYPNPFNATTFINYHLEEKGVVTIDIYAINGQHITTLLSEELDAGSHTKSWNAQDVPSGTYFVHINCAGKVAVQKCLLLK